MTKVEVVGNNLDRALSNFKNKLSQNNVPSELKKRKHYDKPGVAKRNALKAAKKKGHRRTY